METFNKYYDVERKQWIKKCDISPTQIRLTIREKENEGKEEVIKVSLHGSVKRRAS